MRRLALLLVFLAWACPGCGAGAARDDSVRLWTGMADKEFAVLQRLVEEHQQRTGVRVQLLKVPFDQLQNKFLIAAPADLGPDLLIGPQDWVGVLATAGLLEPLPEASRPGSDFVPVSVEAMTLDGQVYAAPLFMECAALFRNPELMPEAPATVEQLVEKAVAVSRSGEGRRGFYYEIENLYFSWAFFSANGAYVFGSRDGRTDPYDVGVDTPGAAEAVRFLRSLRLQDDLIRQGATTDIAKTLFLDGKAALIMNGPWFLGDAKAKGVPYAVDPLPPFADGRQPRPFVGVHGLMLNKAARQRQKALDLMAALTRDDAMIRLSEASGRPPARRTAFERVSRDRDIAAFAKLAESGTPMPNHPATTAVWEPMRQSLEILTNREDADIAAELHGTKERIVQKIRQMME